MKKISDIKTAMMYAEAMYGSTQSSGQEEILYRDATALKTAFDNNADDFLKLNNPLLKFEQKAEVLEAVAQNADLSDSMLNTLKILVQNSNLNILPQVLEQYILLYQKKNNITEIEVTTVMPLSAEQENLLKSKLSAIFNKEILLHYTINPQIIGGLVLKYGTNFIDNSVKHKLDALEQLMKGTK
ncbi:MAG: ATP synthase F1 subunit delta [Alphaproteobacteria bacterium]|nr:ATP synthase F1 subunit delta [Alphaproteobacteria bacterium]